MHKGSGYPTRKGAFSLTELSAFAAHEYQGLTVLSLNNKKQLPRFLLGSFATDRPRQITILYAWCLALLLFCSSSLFVLKF
uniref:Uncharacterized protein n=1 Tax=Oryza brachyantha TaxID=4533 RepID=J3M8M2_ORYBR